MGDKVYSPQIVCVACSIFRKEIERLQEQDAFDAEFRYIDSMLHLRPERLREALVECVEEELAKDRRVLLLFGDCYAHMSGLAKRPGVVRVSGLNCIEILIGKEERRALLKQGAFFLMPEWALRWQEAIGGIPDLSEESVKEIFREQHTRLVYLDTGVERIPSEALDACSAAIGLPWESMAVRLDHLREAVCAGLAEARAVDRAERSDVTNGIRSRGD